MRRELQALLHSREFYQGKTLPERLTEFHVPGLSLAVVHDFRLDLTYAAGTEKHGEDRPITTKTLFQAASISKNVFAAMVLKMAADGLLDLDADVHRYLQDVTIKDVHGLPCAVTLRQILSHTGGLSVGGFQGYKRDEPLPDMAAILQGVPPANSAAILQEAAPGTEVRYSGGGFVVAEKVLLDLIGRSCAEVMQEHILEPMGMRSSTFGQPAGPYACGHTDNNRVIDGDFHIMPEKAAAGLWSNPVELAGYGLRLQRILQGEAGLLAQDTVDMMTTPQTAHTIEVGDGIQQLGLGCFIKGHGENVQFGHTGENEGYVSLMRFHKYKGQGLVVMMNANQGKPLLYEIFAAASAVYGW